MTLENRVVELAQAIGSDVRNILSLLDENATLTVSATAPASPDNGDFWLDSTDMSLSVYYSDVDSSQWVVVSGLQPPNAPEDDVSSVFTYSGGNLTRIDYDNGNYKTFVYVDGTLTQTNFFRVGRTTITKDFTYNPDGTVNTITRTES